MSALERTLKRHFESWCGFCAKLPNASLRTRMSRYLIGLERGVEPQYRTLYLQIGGFKRLAADVRLVCLGSSHAHKGFLATEANGGFNLANSSLDLRLSVGTYATLHRFWNCRHGTVALFYDVFSDGFQTELTSDAFKCVPYDVLLNMTSAYKETWLAHYAAGLKRLKNLPAFEIPAGYRGNNDFAEFAPAEQDVPRRVSGHVKHAGRGSNQTRYLEKLHSLVSTQDRQLLIVIPPYRHDYEKLLPDKRKIYARLFEFLARHRDVRLLDCQDDGDFSTEDFGDADHLNSRGAQKLTDKIMSLNIA